MDFTTIGQVTNSLHFQANVSQITKSAAFFSEIKVENFSLLNDHRGLYKMLIVKRRCCWHQDDWYSLEFMWCTIDCYDVQNIYIYAWGSNYEISLWNVNIPIGMDLLHRHSWLIFVESIITWQIWIWVLWSLWCSWLCWQTRHIWLKWVSFVVKIY